MSHTPCESGAVKAHEPPKALGWRYSRLDRLPTVTVLFQITPEKSCPLQISTRWLARITRTPVSAFFADLVANKKCWAIGGETGVFMIPVGECPGTPEEQLQSAVSLFDAFSSEATHSDGGVA